MSAVATATIVALLPKAAPRPIGLLPWEDQSAFDEVRAGLVAAHSPSNAVEVSLIDRMTWIEWRRQRLLAAEAAVHISHAFDRAGDSSASSRTLLRAGVTDSTVRKELSVPEILRGSDQDDQETVEAIREGVSDVEAALQLIAEGKAYETAVARLDEVMREWWTEALEETDDSDNCKYSASNEGLEQFLTTDALPWRRNWLKANEVRPAIRAQAIAESFDPLRIRQLWEMEARLDRQFEKALAMLIRLQEMRTAKTTPQP